MKLYLLNKSPQLKSISHNLCVFFRSWAKSIFSPFIFTKMRKQRVSGNAYRFPFRSYADLTQLLFFFSRFIRLSAPMFNDIIVLGCIMCLSTIYLFGIRKVNDGNRTMPRICKVRSNVNFMWLSTSQTRKGFHNSFCIQRGQRVHGSLFIYSLFCWSIWELLKKPVKWGLSGMNSFLKWTNLRKIGYLHLTERFDAWENFWIAACGWGIWRFFKR